MTKTSIPQKRAPLTVSPQWTNQTEWLELQQDGEFLLSVQRFNKAEQKFLSAMKVAAPFGGRDARLARSKTGLARAYMARRNWNDAVQQYEEALSIKKKSYGEFHFDVADIDTELALAYVNRNEFQEARNKIDDAKAIWQKLNVKTPAELMMIDAIVETSEYNRASAGAKFKTASDSLLSQIDLHKYPQPVKSMRTARECVERYSNWLEANGGKALAKEYRGKIQPINEWLLILGEES